MPTPTAIDVISTLDVAALKCDEEWRKAGSPGKLHDWRMAWFAAVRLDKQTAPVDVVEPTVKED